MVLVSLFTSGCYGILSNYQMSQAASSVGVSLTPQQIATGRAEVTQQTGDPHAYDAFFWGALRRLSEPQPAPIPSDAGLLQLRTCETHGNYSQVSDTGTYRGAYQFSRATWNAVAAEFRPRLSGVDPATASPEDQDDMAQFNWQWQGRHQWPICGYRDTA
jgi:hypothetical protein